MELDESIKHLEQCSKLGIVPRREAIKTVLQALENYKIHDEKYMNGELFSAKQMKFIEKEYIPKKKVEELVSHLKLLKRHMALNDEERAIFDVCIKDVQELLER